MNNNEYKSNNKKLVWILLIIIIILITLVGFMFTKRQKNDLPVNECKCENSLSCSYSLGLISTFSLLDVKKGVVDPEDGMTYTKIKLLFENKYDEQIYMDSYMFYVYDSDNNKLANCNSRATADNKKSDMLAEILPARGGVEGYLYCETESTNAKILKMVYIKGFHFKSDGSLSPDYRELTIEFSD